MDARDASQRMKLGNEEDASPARPASLAKGGLNLLTSGAAITDHKMSGNWVMNSNSSTGTGVAVGLMGAAADVGILTGTGLFASGTGAAGAGVGLTTAGATPGRGIVTEGAVAGTAVRAATGTVAATVAVAAFGGITLFGGTKEVTGIVGIALGGIAPVIGLFDAMAGGAEAIPRRGAAIGICPGRGDPGINCDG